jgi:hypothetical protein
MLSNMHEAAEVARGVGYDRDAGVQALVEEGMSATSGPKRKDDGMGWRRG